MNISPSAVFSFLLITGREVRWAESPRGLGLTARHGKADRLLPLHRAMHLFGLLFGVWQRNQALTLPRTLIAGLVTGVIFWILIALLLGTGIHHRKLDFSEFLYGFVMLLVYGALLDSVYYQRVTSERRKATWQAVG